MARIVIEGGNISSFIVLEGQYLSQCGYLLVLNFSSIALMLLLTLLNLWPIPLISTLTILIVSAFDYLLCPCPFIFVLDTDSTSPVREYASFGRKQWSTSPTITWSPWRWSFSKHTQWWRRERKVYWSKFWFILVLEPFVFSLLWIGKYLEDSE